MSEGQTCARLFTAHLFSERRTGKFNRTTEPAQGRGGWVRWARGSGGSKKGFSLSFFFSFPRTLLAPASVSASRWLYVGPKMEDWDVYTSPSGNKRTNFPCTLIWCGCEVFAQAWLNIYKYLHITRQFRIMKFKRFPTAFIRKRDIICQSLPIGAPCRFVCCQGENYFWCWWARGSFSRGGCQVGCACSVAGRTHCSRVPSAYRPWTSHKPRAWSDSGGPSPRSIICTQVSPCVTCRQSRGRPRRTVATENPGDAKKQTK